MRHAYVLDGVVPISAVAETEKKFGPTTRAHSRVLGLEAIGRFKPDTVKLIGGGHAYVYNMSYAVDKLVGEYCCIVPPAADAIWAMKLNTKNEDGTKNWGSWQRCEAPEGLQGFSSKGNREPSEKQMNWWSRAAHRYGLDPEQEVTRKTFAILPVLSDIGESL